MISWRTLCDPGITHIHCVIQGSHTFALCDPGITHIRSHCVDIVSGSSPLFANQMRRMTQEAEVSGRAQPRSIVNISSTSGTHGNNGQANYATAKV